MYVAKRYAKAEQMVQIGFRLVCDLSSVACCYAVYMYTLGVFRRTVRDACCVSRKAVFAVRLGVFSYAR